MELPRKAGPHARKAEYGCGTVFELTPTGTETVLYSFKGGSDGYSPGSSLLIDAGGNLYGTTTWGGSCSRCGTVFRIAQDGTETVLHSFQGGSDGETPFSGVIEDGSGNLYGTTLSGGGGCEGDYGLRHRIQARHRTGQKPCFKPSCAPARVSGQEPRCFWARVDFSTERPRAAAFATLAASFSGSARIDCRFCRSVVFSEQRLCQRLGEILLPVAICVAPGELAGLPGATERQESQ